MDLSRYLAIIPARAGSKRLPGKNFRDFCGKPLWQWSMECAREVGIRMAVTSDRPYDELEWAGLWIRRPAFLCTDSASTWEAVEHVCYVLEHFGPIVLLQPTSPLRTVAQVRDAVEDHAAHANRQQRVFVYTSDAGEMEPNGGVYVSCWKEWVDGHTGLTICRQADTGPDINSRKDWDRAEATMLRRLKETHEEAGP